MAEENLSPEGDAAAPSEADAVAAAEPAPAPAEGAPEAPAAEPAPEPQAEPESEAAEEKPAEIGPSEEKPAEPAEKPPEAEAKVAEAEKPAEPAATNYEFKFPEGLTPAEEPLKAFQTVLGKYGLTQEAGQELMDLHAQGLQEAVADLRQRQQDDFDATRAKWVADFAKQAGNRQQTVLDAARRVITTTITDKKERAELWSVLAFTGAGDHPAVINALAKIDKRLGERAAPAKGLPDSGAKSGAPWDKRYGNGQRT